jgi:hypothetical protein
MKKHRIDDYPPNGAMQRMCAEMKAQQAKMRPLILSGQALWESLFPPESPTSRRRGGNKTGLGAWDREAVMRILDVMTGHPFDMQAEFSAAMKNADPVFFRMMADAAQYVRDMPHAHSLFAKHVIAARRIAAGMMKAGQPFPKWSEVRRRVSDQMGQAAYGDKSPEWSRVKGAAQLTDLPR